MFDARSAVRDLAGARWISHGGESAELVLFSQNFRMSGKARRQSAAYYCRLPVHRMGERRVDRTRSY